MTQRVVNYTYGTGNPVLPNGSVDVRDGIDNIQSFDIFMNADEDTYNQRDGGVVKTVHGMIGEFNQLISDQESEFNQHITGMAFTRVGTFESGTTLDDLREVLLWDVSDGGDGHEYGWTGSFPKVVAPNSTPSSSGGIGPGAWVDRTDVTLRSELISNNQIPVTVSQFGGTSGFANDSTAALIAFINAINSGGHEGSEFLIDGLYRTTQPLPAITKTVKLRGITTAKSAILFDNVLDGIKLDHSSLTDAAVHSYVGYFSVLTNKTIAGTGFKYIPSSMGGGAVKLEINSFRADSLSRFTGATSNSEWLTGIHLGDASFGFKPSEVRIYNTVVYGSDSNQNYSTLTGTGSSGIIVEKSTNCIIKDVKVFLLDGYGILFRGQSEGCGVYHSQAVAVRKGIFFTGLINPSNNHFISTTHIAPYETGIFVEPPAETPSVSTPIAYYFSDTFILERGDSVAKSTRFIGLDVATRFSKMTNITVWANAKTGVVHEKIGFRVACAGNTLVNCHSHNMTYSIETFEVIPNYVYGVELCDFFDEGSITGFISPLSLINPTGSVRTSTQLYNRPLYYANQMTVIHDSGVPIFGVNAGTVFNRSPTGSITNYNHIPNDQTVTGAQLTGLGGTATPNSGNWNILSALALFSGDIRPSTANTKVVGTPGAPWAGGNTQTAFNVTSDERYKTPSTPIADAMLDAWAEVEWIQYQYLERVEAKGIDGARWHYGVIAQRTMEAFSRHGLDASKYGFLCHDEWEATDEVVDAEFGHIITPALAAGDRYGIRYEEALALEAALQRRNYKRQQVLNTEQASAITDLLARVDALEAK